MGFIKLPSNSEKILLELAQAENPTQALNAHGRYLFLLSLIFDTKNRGCSRSRAKRYWPCNDRIKSQQSERGARRTARPNSVPGSAAFVHIESCFSEVQENGFSFR